MGMGCGGCGGGCKEGEVCASSKGWRSVEVVDVVVESNVA